MSAKPENGLELVRAVRAALGTAEGRTAVREIVAELRRAEEDAEIEAPTCYEDELVARARRRDKERKLAPKVVRGTRRPPSLRVTPPRR